MNGLEMKYFILKPKGSSPYHKASRAAMNQYARLIEQENPELAEQLREWTFKEMFDDIEKQELTLKDKPKSNFS